MDLKGKNVLVTGACGFIGSHLVERLIESGAEVRAFVYYNSFNRWGWLETLPEEKLQKLEVFTGDIRDSQCVKRATDDVELVFHLAALIGIPYSYIAPESYVETNIRGTLNVLQAARDVGAVKFIHTSTSEVYGTAQYVPIDEKHPLQGQSPYAASKIAADMLVQSFYRSFDLPVVICRPFNTYGPRQSARAIIPTIITQVTGKRLNVQLGNTNTTRDFNYVTDVVEGFVKIAEHEDVIGEVINIGSGHEISIAGLVEKISGLSGIDLNTKAKNLLGWEPRVQLDEGIIRTLEWFGKNPDGYKQEIYNV
jgi:NAD dependent epimerase/dehydratase